MEEEIKSISIPSRPTKPQDSTKAKLEETYGKYVSDEERNKMLKVMKTAKKGGLSNNPYINMKTCVDWRSIQSKKLERDWARYVLAIILEPILVPSYRSNLLTESPAATFLRAAAHALLSNHCRRRNTLEGVQQSYVFVDGIKVTGDIPEKPVIDIELTIKNRERQSSMQTMLQELSVTVRKFEKLKGIAARPGSDLMEDGIKDAFDVVIEVSFKLIISYNY
jgi:hypothetical protein